MAIDWSEWMAIARESPVVQDIAAQTIVQVRNTRTDVTVRLTVNYQGGRTLPEAKARLEAATKTLIAQRDLDNGPIRVVPSGTNLDLADIPPVVTPPTQAELERAAFFTDYANERTQQTLATLSPSLASRYKSEYGALR